jgi:hypothetical protein
VVFHPQSWLGLPPLPSPQAPTKGWAVSIQQASPELSGSSLGFFILAFRVHSFIQAARAHTCRAEWVGRVQGRVNNS